MQISPARFFFLFRPTIKIKGSLFKKQANELSDKHVQCCFCYVIKSAGEAANKVLLTVIGNSLRIKINLSQIMTLSIKREKVCAVCPYLLFIYFRATLGVKVVLQSSKNPTSIF